MLSFAHLSNANLSRCESPIGFNHKLDSWSLSDWLVALGGEVGEAMNVAKKLNRVRDGIPGNKVTETVLWDQLADELADAAIYLDLAAQYAGISLEKAIVNKFNRKSREIGYPFMLSAPPVLSPEEEAELQKIAAECGLN